MPRTIACRIHEHGYSGGIAIAIPAAEQKDRQRLPLDFLPNDRGNLATHKFVVVGTLNRRGRTHDSESALEPMTDAQQSRLFRLMDAYTEGLGNADFVPSPGLQCACCEFFNESRAWH